MQAADEESGVTDLELYKVLCFVALKDDVNSKYDFRARSLDTAMDLIVGILGRPAYKDVRADISITIGELNFSTSGTAQCGLEQKLEGCLQIMAWRFA